MLIIGRITNGVWLFVLCKNCQFWVLKKSKIERTNWFWLIKNSHFREPTGFRF